MARIRTIKPTFFTSEDICKLTPLARLLFQGLWVEADKEGYLADKPFQLKTRILPADACDVDALLWDLAEGGLIARFSVPAPDGSGEKQFIGINEFKKHQRPHPKEPDSTIPAGTRTPRFRPAPQLAVEKNGKQVVTPGSIPSSPVGMDKEYGVPDKEIGERERNGRARLQGSGAFEPGSLPRDHMRHALCGPSMRICLLSWQFDVLATAYNAPENPHGTRAVIAQFVEQLESGLKPESSLGPFSWVEKEFHTYLKSIGRVAPKLEVKPKVRGVAELLAEEEARKAQRRPS